MSNRKSPENTKEEEAVLNLYVKSEETEDEEDEEDDTPKIEEQCLNFNGGIPKIIKKVLINETDYVIEFNCIRK